MSDTPTDASTLLDALSDHLPFSVVHPTSAAPTNFDEFCDAHNLDRTDLIDNRVCSFTLVLDADASGINTHPHPTITVYEHDLVGYLVTVTLAPEYILLGAYTMHHDPASFLKALITLYETTDDDLRVAGVDDLSGPETYTDAVQSAVAEYTADDTVTA